MLYLFRWSKHKFWKYDDTVAFNDSCYFQCFPFFGIVPEILSENGEIIPKNSNKEGYLVSTIFFIIIERSKQMLKIIIERLLSGSERSFQNVYYAKVSFAVELFVNNRCKECGFILLLGIQTAMAWNNENSVWKPWEVWNHLLQEIPRLLLHWRW